MCSTISTTTSVSSYEPGIRHAAFRTYITIYTLQIITTLLLLMVLIWHTSTTRLVEKFDMPHIWEEDFVRQQLGGLKFEVWVLVFVAVPIDLLYALLSLGYYHRQLNAPDKTTERLPASGSVSSGTAKGVEKNSACDRSNASLSLSARESQGTPNDATEKRTQTTPHNDDSQATVVSDEDPAMPPPPPTKSRTNHSLLSRQLTPTEHMLLSTIWDALMITILSLHIFSFFTNIAPSLAFCYTPAALNYPNWAFHDTDTNWRNSTERPPKLGMKERCERINWSIHSSGGFSTAGAAVLAALHFLASLWRVGGAARPWVRRRWADSISEHSQDGERGGVKWALDRRDDHISGDMDVVDPRASADYSQASGHATSISEEEQNTGLKQRRKASSSSEHRNGTGEKTRTGPTDPCMWIEALLECLLP
ncbi:Nn.00g009910.m01.CDS01 [Neocucurbitaria sp. VM-36]